MLFMEVPYDSKVEHLTGGYGKRPVIEDINFELKARGNCWFNWIKWCRQKHNY